MKFTQNQVNALETFALALIGAVLTALGALLTSGQPSQGPVTLTFVALTAVSAAWSFITSHKRDFVALMGSFSPLFGAVASATVPDSVISSSEPQAVATTSSITSVTAAHTLEAPASTNEQGQKGA